jgi:hypothetical protein
LKWSIPFTDDVILTPPATMKLKSLQVLSVFTFVLYAPVRALQPLPLPAAPVVDFGLGVWIENIRIRMTGEILTVGPTSPSLHQVNPLGNPTPVLVHNFSPPIASLLGITETLPDVFYVTAGNISNTTLTPVPRSFSVWEVNMAGFDIIGQPANVRKVADFPDANLLDGMTTVDAEAGLVLISDTVLGVVWSLNVNTGATAQIINLPDMKSIAGKIPTLGVNGVHYTNGYLYYTSTDQQLFVRLPIHSDGSAAGAPSVIAGSFGELDDFDLDNVDNGFLVVNATAISLVQPNGAEMLLSGGSGASALPGPTCARFGCTPSDETILYVGTTGGSFQYPTQKFTTPGGILKIEVGVAGYFDYA